MEARKLPPGAGKPVPGVAAPALTFLRSFPFPIAASQTREIPMADTAPNGPQGAGAVVSERAGPCGLICKLGRSRKCWESGPRRSRGSLLSGLGLLVRVEVGRGPTVSEDVRGSYRFLFLKRQQAGLEQVALTCMPTCMPRRLGLLASSHPSVPVLCPKVEDAT